jgi:hypothetical protein
MEVDGLEAVDRLRGELIGLGVERPAESGLGRVSHGGVLSG